MNNTLKKVILILAEGISDEDSLIRYFKEIKKSRNIAFEIARCDVTILPHTKTKNPKTHVVDQINNFLDTNTNRYIKEDIEEVIHIVDLDGAFISDNFIHEDKNIENIQYSNNSIVCQNKDSIVKRNETKRKSINTLSTTTKVKNLNYKMYYFSRNLEHVLHNISSSNLTNDDKKRLSKDFKRRYRGNIEGFKNFINSPEFAVSGDYNESWRYIKEGLKSLERYTNIHLFINE